MNLGIFLAIGESLKDFEEKGQLKRLVNYNIKKYAQNFDKVYIFSYADEKVNLPKNCILISNKTFLHRYLYAPLIPVLHSKEVSNCDVLRGLQITGGIPCITAKLIFKKPFIINYGYNYAQVAKIEGKKFQHFFYPIVREITGFFADLILVTSKDLVKNLKYISKQKIHLAHSAGVDLNLFKPKKRPFKKNNLEVIFVGRLERQKNLESLIKAVSMIKQKKVKLTFVGSGSLKKNLIVLSKQLKVTLQIIPFVDYEKIPAFLCSADIFVLPSLVEGNAKVVTEAMACGIPVIGSKVEGIKKIIEHKKTGLLCGTTPKSIYAAIVRLFDHKLRKKISQNARKFVEEQYDFNKIFNQEILFLKKIAK